MQKVVSWFRKLFNGNLEQSIAARDTNNTIINQSATVFNFFIPGIILLTALIILGIWGYTEYWSTKYNNSLMASGNLNVVIVPFSDQTSGKCKTDREIGELVASAFYTVLTNGEYDKTSSVQPVFRPPNEVAPLNGKSNTELTILAEQLARDINAQIVIYGIIQCSKVTNKPFVKVMFFVTPTGFSDANELIGEFSFSSGPLYGNLKSGQEFLGSNQNLREKINVMSLVVNSLGSYLGENYSQALKTILAALESSLWESEGGKEVIYILAGNIETRYAQQLSFAGHEKEALDEIEKAQVFYTLANSTSQSEGLGESGRAYIGLAGVEHFYGTYKSRMTCKLEDIDIEKFISEKEYLAKAGNALNSPLTADIPLKVAFNTAQIDLTRYSMDPTSIVLDDIAKNYNQVISSYTDLRDPNLRVLEMAAHSYAGLAFINWYIGNAQGVERNFNLAIMTTETPSLQVGYLKAFGNYYFYNQNYEKALAYYREALGLVQEFQIKSTNCDTDINDLVTETEKKIKQ